MRRKSIQEIDFFPNQDRQRKASAQKNHLPIARCVCGYEILVVPDLKAMNLAINNHLTAHKKTLTDSAERLTEQVLIVASKITLPSFN